MHGSRLFISFIVFFWCLASVEPHIADQSLSILSTSFSTSYSASCSVLTQSNFLFLLLKIDLKGSASKEAAYANEKKKTKFDKKNPAF